ncbi:MAG: rhamnulokinase [Acidobacteriota bacterium]|nr:rhamnulokinase [Acidobacteriota bacterium]
MKRFLAIDLGAESGRAMLGTFDGGRIALEEIHRWPNEPVRLSTGLYWDTLRLFHEIRRALSMCGGIALDGIGVDTWGVDFALLDADGALADNPRHYRDARTNGMLDRAFAVVPREQIFADTGIQFMQLNTLYQWYAMKLAGAPALRIARRMLFMPDLFNYWLTGVARAERSIASTSQFYDPFTKNWAAGLLRRFDLDATLLPEIAEPGERLGALLPEIAESCGLSPQTPVYATACHDTAAAVAAVPAEHGDWCYISSGTWSLMGVEIPEPLINDRSLVLNFTNETGAGGRIRLLKNIAGLWLLQECRRAWSLAGTEYSYEQLTSLAASVKSPGVILDPDAFAEPGRMPDRIAAWCREARQPVPEGPAAITRAILESLALAYRNVLDSLEALLGRRIETIHIVGGGSRNRLLNQLTANATGRTVVAGPVEATAAGNVLVQAIGAGAIADLEEARGIVRASFPLERYSPE